MTLPATNRIGDLTRQLLDRGYEQATRQTLNAIGASVNSGLIGQRLSELEAEAARLEAAGERLRPDNAVLRALLADLDTELARIAARVDVGAADAQRTGLEAAARLTRELALPGVDDRTLASIGVTWNVPDPEAVNRLVGYVNSAGWAEELAAYPETVLNIVQNQAIQGIVEGWNPLRTAQMITRMAQGVPLAQANTLMRTVQLQSYRDAAVMHRVANADILTEQIRIAALDARTCMACVALHGTRLPIDERINDHHNGRCTSISVVKGRPRDIQSGEDWFKSLPDERQREQMGSAAWLAWKDGALNMRDLVHRYDDRVFGEMLREGSLRGALGDAAREYYQRARLLPPLPRERNNDDRLAIVTPEDRIRINRARGYDERGNPITEAAREAVRRREERIRNMPNPYSNTGVTIGEDAPSAPIPPRNG
jgi:hypothetical protein